MLSLLEPSRRKEQWFSASLSKCRRSTVGNRDVFPLRVTRRR
ncbi:unnamed protein product, partial [Larinioides sclopetarius]